MLLHTHTAGTPRTRDDEHVWGFPENSGRRRRFSGLNPDGRAPVPRQDQDCGGLLETLELFLLVHPTLDMVFTVCLSKARRAISAVN